MIEWAFRSSILILSGAPLLRLLRVKDPSIRLASWSAMLAGSLLIPVLAAALPELPLDTNVLTRPAVSMRSLEAPAGGEQADSTSMPALSRENPRPVTRGYSAAEKSAVNSGVFVWRSEWSSVAAVSYVVIAGVLLLRVFIGLAISLRLLRDSRATSQTSKGIEIRESDRILAPLTLGIARPAIVLPADWRQWDGGKFEAVLAHERSHASRHDPALQFLSMIHRALLWHSPLSWFLHKRIVQAAEDVSDDAAVAATGNRVAYAEVLLGFIGHNGRSTTWSKWSDADWGGVAMARYGLPEERIHRIIHGTMLYRGMSRWSLAAILALGFPLVYLVATAQARPQFEVADVHISPASAAGRKVGQMDGVTGNVMTPFIDAVRGGRYEIHNATMMDLIRIAYGVEADAVFGGAGWLTSDWDRFDVIAKPPAGGTTSASIRLMLQSLLADRFKLVVRNDTRPVRAWVLSKAPGEPKLKAANGSDEPACRIVDDNERVSCRNATMNGFVAAIRGGMLTTLPVVNSTGIEGAWDFDLHYTVTRGYFGVAENNPILDVVEKELGLKLELRNIPQPVLIVDSVNRNPTANAADIEKRLPPDPVEFEVASIRPCEAVNLSEGRYSASGQVTTGCMGLQMLIALAWDLRGNNGALLNRIEGAPSWLNSKRFNIVAKAPIPIGDASDTKFRAMLRNLLVDRFKMMTHYEDRLVDVYELVGAKPKLNKADSSGRTGCKLNGGAGFIVGIPSVMTCQNVTLAQFAEELGAVGDRPGTRRLVVDTTAIEGAWDLTLKYRVGAPRNAVEGGVPTDPGGDVTQMEALEKQLGLKLREGKRAVPVFVLDHIEENPTEN